MIRSVPRLWLVLDIVGAAFAFLVTTPLSFVMIVEQLSSWLGTGPLSISITILVSLAMWAAAAIARLAPLPALMIAWGAAIVQMAAGLSPALYDTAVFVVLFATAAWGTRTVLWIGGGSTLAGGVIAGVYLAVLFDSGMIQDEQAALRRLALGVLMGSSVLFSLVISWGAGLLWRVVLNGRRTREAQIAAEAVAAAEQERVRIARDMHDVVAHSLAVVIAQSDGARYAAAADPAQATAALTTIGQTARSALADVRLLLAQLRHRQGQGPQPTLADLETLYGQVRAAGIEPRVTVDPMPPGEPPAAIQLAVYRILQEALTNALRHGGGDVDVHLAWEMDRVRIRVENAVTGDASASAGTGGGHGIIGMRERAQLVGGTLSAGRDHDRFVVDAALPIGPPTGTEA
ncbi:MULTISPECIES: sensor histidine kinase [unclassified Microbacterium]|uniref:sensor histidine kinase n=1 Tax=unclassified Microbacterium TaxID=2609290 RepID=UPI00300FDCD7